MRIANILHKGRPLVAGLAIVVGLVGVGCDGTTGSNVATGGSSSSGGKVAASGGTNTGGNTATGGVSASGGSPRTGGATTGGATTGGATTGGATTGGATTGGSAGSGGSASGGSGGRDAGTSGDVASGGGARSGGAPRSGGNATGGVVGSGGGSSGGAVGSGGNATGGATGGQPATGGNAGSGGDAGTGGSDAGAGTYEPCPASGQCKVMPLGDSITEGTGFAGGYRGFLYSKAVADGKNITFVGSLTSNPPNGIANFPKSHEGHFAWTIQQIDNIVPTPTLNVSPHIVLLHIGTNDVNQNLSGAPARLKSLISQIVTTLPDTLVVVAKIIPEPSKASQISAYNTEVPGIVKEFADSGKHVILIDQFTGFPSSELGDGVHPNQAGYSRMANTWYATIKPFLH